MAFFSAAWIDMMYDISLSTNQLILLLYCSEMLWVK